VTVVLLKSRPVGLVLIDLDILIWVIICERNGLRRVPPELLLLLPEALWLMHVLAHLVLHLDLLVVRVVAVVGSKHWE